MLPFRGPQRCFHLCCSCIPCDVVTFLSLQADVYVNTANSTLDLSQRGVVSALVKAAGPNLQAECTEKAPISVGNIAVTGGGSLQCHYIFHVVASQYHHQEKQAKKVRV